MFNIDLSGKTAVVTGGGSGLARETAGLLAECGANIVIGDIQLDKAREAAQEFTKYGVKTEALRVDVSSRGDMQKLFETAEGITGRLDIAVNAAGICLAKTLTEASLEEIERVVNVNIMGMVHADYFAYEAMKSRGGRVMNFASAAGRGPNLIMPYYAMAKAAIINLTQSYALMAAPQGVCFNAICPGIIQTPMWEKILDVWTDNSDDKAARDAAFNARVSKRIPLGIAQESIDIANAVVFLCSDRARYITGQTLNVDGGINMN